MVSSAPKLTPSNKNCTPTTPTLSDAVVSTLIVAETVDPFNGEVIETQVSVKHASQDIHVTQNKQWIQERLKEEIRDGQELWKRRTELFPSLEFGNSVEKQLCDLQTGNSHLSFVIRILFELENYCKTWTQGHFDMTHFSNVSPESEATLNQYSDERTFRCPDGQTRLFSLHFKISLKAWRIYFYLQTPNDKVIVGYIGRHLRTAKFS
mgnify:CR=1 FL=1